MLPRPLAAGVFWFEWRSMDGRFEKFGRIEKILVRAVSEAKADFEARKEEFNLANARIADLGLNHPDSATGLTQASKAYKRALAKYRDALMVFNRFILDGEVPEDIKPR